MVKMYVLSQMVRSETHRAVADWRRCTFFFCRLNFVCRVLCFCANGRAVETVHMKGLSCDIGSTQA